jgi:hypothetical protein
VSGQWRLAPQMVLRRVERTGRRAELLRHDYPVPVEVDPLPTQRIKLTGTQTRERRHLQPGGKRRARQFARVSDHLPYLLLGWGLLVASALAQPRLLPGGDCRIVLSFGANDTSVEHERMRVDADRSSDTLAEVLDQAATIGLPRLVLGPAPVDDPEQNQRIHSLSLLFGEVCAERGVPFVSVIEPLLASPVWMEQVAVGDGAHPGAEGYDALGRLVLAGGWLDWLRVEAP